MDFKKSKVFLIRLMVAYWVFALMIYAVSFQQFKYTDATGEAPAAATIIGEFTDGHEIRQTLLAPLGTLRGVSVMTATYGRKNEGEMVVALEDADGNRLTEFSVPLADFNDGEYTEILFPEPIDGYETQALTLCLSTRGSGEGNAATMYFGTTYAGTQMLSAPVDPSNYFQIDGNPGQGMLCARLDSRYERRFYKTFWVIVIGVFALAALLCAIWWRQALKGKNNPLVVLCTLKTRYALLFNQLVSRDFKTKYKRSMLGMLWSFLNPLLTMAVQYVVFSTLFRSNIKNYPVYLLTGIVFFNFFNEAVGLGMTSITSNASLIKKVYMPKYIYPISRVASSMINFLLALVPLLLVMLITGTGLHFSLLLLVFDVACLLGFITGMSLLLTTCMTFFQDTQFLWGVVSMIWMYLTPIFYPESIIPARMITGYRMNPLYQFITFARICIINGISPQPEMYLGCIVSACAALLLGAAVFKKCQDRFILYL